MKNKKITQATESYFDKNVTDIIKGIMILFMFVHHFFTFPNWYIHGISYPELERFAALFCLPFKICVPVFAFLTGYFYNYKSKKGYMYSLQKISNLLITYWLVYIPYLCIACYLGYIDFEWKNFLFELFALKRPIMNFCWYVYFYLCTMLILPILTESFSNKIYISSIKKILLPAIVATILAQEIDNAIIKKVCSDFGYWFPCVACGFICAQYKLFSNCFDKLFKEKKSELNQVLIMLSLAILTFIGRYFCRDIDVLSLNYKGSDLRICINMDVIYAPLFVYSVVNLVNVFPFKKILVIFSALGKYSLHMWFIHCIFFNICKESFQKILYWPHNPIFVIIWGAILCNLLARIWDIPISGVLKLKNVVIKRYT